jgi:hypothetical protein
MFDASSRGMGLVAMVIGAQSLGQSYSPFQFDTLISPGSRKSGQVSHQMIITPTASPDDIAPLSILSVVLAAQH